MQVECYVSPPERYDRDGYELIDKLINNAHF